MNWRIVHVIFLLTGYELVVIALSYGLALGRFPIVNVFLLPAPLWFYYFLIQFVNPLTYLIIFFAYRILRPSNWIPQWAIQHRRDKQWEDLKKGIPPHQYHPRTHIVRGYAYLFLICWELLLFWFALRVAYIILPYIGNQYFAEYARVFFPLTPYYAWTIIIFIGANLFPLNWLIIFLAFYLGRKRIGK